MAIHRTKLVDRTKIARPREARIFVIATEGAHTEPGYFEALQEEEVIDHSRVHVKLLPTAKVGDSSAPPAVLDRLITFEQQYAFVEGLDELWLVLDVDRWLETGALQRTASDALRRKYRLAISNPCFELWLLLHATDELDGGGSCKDLAARLQYLDPSRSTLIDVARIKSAVDRAAALDTSPSDPWPQAIGTHVYRLVTALLAHAVPRR